MFVAFNSLCQFSYSSDIKSHTFFLLYVCPSRRPRSDTQGVCDEADGPVPETCRDDSQQAPLTYAHTGSVVPDRPDWVPVDCTQAQTEAEAQGRDTPHVRSETDMRKLGF